MLRKIIILVLFVLPISAGAADASRCALSAAQRAELLERFAHAASKTPYGNEWWPCPSQEHCKNFPPGTVVGDLIGEGRQLILFRDIGGTYVRGYRGTGPNNYIVGEMDAYSYSLAPNIVHQWGSSGTKAYSLIAIQSLDTDKLRYPADFMGPPDKLSPEQRWPLVKAETPENGIAYYDEIKVPITAENVVVTVPTARLTELVDQFGNFDAPKGPYSVMDLLKNVLASPYAEDPNCKR